MPVPQNSTRSPTRHRWLRFRLRAMLIVVALLAIPLAWVANERRTSSREQEVARQLRDLGIRVELGGVFDSWEIGLGDEQSWWRLQARRILGQRIVSIRGFPSDFTDLAPLAGLTNLRLLLCVKAQ